MSRLRCATASSHPPRPQRSEADGFTLPEMLVALVVAGLAVTAVLDGFAASLRLASASEKIVAAALVARARLEETGVAVPLRPGSQVGVDGAFRWRRMVAVPPDHVPGASLTILAVTITVSWEGLGGGHEYQLTSLRLAPLEASRREAAR